MLLNTKVKKIIYGDKGVSVIVHNERSGKRTLEADYVLVSFSLGVLQHDDVAWEQKLPMWKREAIHSMNMVS